MKPRDVTRVLIEGNPNLLGGLASEVEDAYPIKVISAPQMSLVMTKVEDPITCRPFYLGEVLVTKCTVMVNQHDGLGVILGDLPDRAYQLAVVMAALRAKLPETLAWQALLEAEQRAVAQKQNEEFTRADKSRVHFETMEEHYAKP